MNILSRIFKRGGTVTELFTFLWKRKLWWLTPIVLTLVVIGVLLILLHTVAPVAPFIYTFF